MGWGTSALNESDLSVRAARARVLVHHTDRGSLYASDDYRRVLVVHSITASMSRTGDCYDNTAAEEDHTYILA